MPSFSIVFTTAGAADLERLKREPGLAKQLKAVRKTLGRLETNPRHPGLQNHEFRSLAGIRGEKVFVAYAEQDTPAAYRVFWHYGPEKGKITVIAITSHP